MRGIGKGQTITALVIPEVSRLIKAELASPTKSWPVDIVSWLTVNSMRGERMQYKQLCTQEIGHVWRRRAFESTASFLQVWKVLVMLQCLYCVLSVVPWPQQAERVVPFQAGSVRVGKCETVWPKGTLGWHTVWTQHVAFAPGRFSVAPVVTVLISDINVSRVGKSVSVRGGVVKCTRLLISSAITMQLRAEVHAADVTGEGFTLRFYTYAGTCGGALLWSSADLEPPCRYFNHKIDGATVTWLAAPEGGAPEVCVGELMQSLYTTSQHGMLAFIKGVLSPRCCCCCVVDAA